MKLTYTIVDIAHKQIKNSFIPIKEEQMVVIKVPMTRKIRCCDYGFIGKDF